MHKQPSIAYVLNNDFLRPTLDSVYSPLENTNSFEKITFHFLVYENKKHTPQKFIKMIITLFNTWWLSDPMSFKRDLAEKNKMLHSSGNVKPFPNKRKMSKPFLWGSKIQSRYIKILRKVESIV